MSPGAEDLFLLMNQEERFFLKSELEQLTLREMLEILITGPDILSGSSLINIQEAVNVGEF